jgi:REP element-mobilizing transposase RayT
MGHSYTNLLYHLVWGTKQRHPWLNQELRPDLFAHLKDLVREQGGIPLAVNGVEDHVHLLVRLRQDVAVAEVLRVLKARSSRWLHEKHPECAGFAWQTGYGAFTVSFSQVGRVVKYIDTQEEHHRGKPFADEFRRLLRVHGVEFCEETLWD